MKRLFLGTSFSGHVDYETGQVNPEYRAHIESILASLREVGKFTVFCAAEHEGWVISSHIPAEVGVEKDLAEIDKSDVLLALPPADIISGGLQYEAGYADGRGKLVILATEAGSKLGYFNQGVVGLGRAIHVEFDSPESLTSQVGKIIGQK